MLLIIGQSLMKPFPLSVKFHLIFLSPEFRYSFLPKPKLKLLLIRKTVTQRTTHLNNSAIQPTTIPIYSNHSLPLSRGTCVPIAGRIQRCTPTGMKWLTRHISQKRKNKKPARGTLRRCYPRCQIKNPRAGIS